MKTLPTVKLSPVRSQSQMMDETKERKNPDLNTFGEVCLRRQRRKRQKLLLIELLLDYAKHSTLHGLRYVTETGVSLAEKIFWILTFIISVAMCSILIQNVWIKWKTSPVIVSFSERIVPVGMVPFPSVTICPQIKSMSSKYNFTKEFQRHLILYNTTKGKVSESNLNSTDSDYELELRRLEDIALVCDPLDYKPFLKDNYTDAAVVEHIREVSPTMNETFLFCVWKNNDINCSDIFKEVLTKEGICFNFNSLAADDIFNKSNIQNEYDYLLTTTKTRNWSQSEGYTTYDPDEYPRRAMENGATPDLEVNLIENPNEKNGFCNGFNRGFKIYVQHPADVPQSTLYYYAALPKQVSSLALKFNMLTTAESLLNYDPEIRQCYFPKDRPLRYFNMYSANNCRLECQSNYTFEKCGCVMFYMPHYESQHICTILAKECVIEALDELRTEEIQAEMGLNVDACRCYPDCHNVYYDAEILKTEYDLKSYIRTYEKIHNEKEHYGKGLEFSKIEMYFKQPRFVSMRRSELFGPTDFVANCGGLLSLFLGFSFLSLIEIFYFVTLRLYYALKRDLRKEELERKKSLADSGAVDEKL